MTGSESPGGRLSAAVSDAYVLEPHELVLLDQAAATLDLCDSLQKVLDEAGVTADGGTVVNPVARELRQQRLTLARLLAALRIPTEDDESGARLQRRALRGVYQPRGA